MYTKTYTTPMTMAKYDQGRIIGYLNEEIIEGYVPESPDPEEESEPCTGYRYTGAEPDGGTLMPCTDPSDYGDVTNAIIRSKYSDSQEMAIHRHHANDAEASAEEWEAYNTFCEAAKAQAKAWLGLE